MTRAILVACLIAAILSTTSVAEAAGGKISGKVIEAGSGTPLSGVAIVATGPMRATTTTMGDGSFTLAGLAPGNYILIMSLAGYETAQSNSITVAEGMAQAVTLTIARESASATTALGPDLTIPPPLFTYAGDARAFYFGRTNGNSCLTCKTTGTPNATAFNFGGTLHGQINIPRTPFVLGATYFGAYPFGANWPGPLNNIGYNPQVDNTLPGYSISTFGEMYLQYQTVGTFFQTGKEELTTKESPWAHTSDSRDTPASFQGTLFNTSPTHDFNFGAMYMARFRSRVTSAFNSNTLLTSCNTAYPDGKGPVPGIKGTFTVPGDPCNKQHTNNGFLQLSASYIFGNSGLVANAFQYQYYDIASMTYVNAQWNFMKASKFNPFVAGQYVGESQFGQAFIGTVHSYTFGGQFGATINHNLNFAASYNGSPYTTYVVPVKDCDGSASSPAKASPGVIFGGVANKSIKGLPKADVTCYGGGIASPYTDNYATDPLYTTQISQGMADVHKPGTGAKAALTWQSDNRRVRAILSDAWYNYSLPGAGNGDSRSEFNFDVQYFFNPVYANRPYKGLSIRQRYADRTQPFSPYEFKYSRTQLEYTF